MIQTLWPKLCDVLYQLPKPQRELKELFLAYVEASFGGPRPLPMEFANYAKDQGLPLIQTLPSSLGASSLSPPSEGLANNGLITGVAFSNIFKDDDKSWNEVILQRKWQIEQNLHIIMRHAVVKYGRGLVEEEKVGMGAAVARIQCVTVLPDDISERNYSVVKMAAAAIADHLRAAGADEALLDKVMVGAAWKGSLCLLLEAPECLIHKLFDGIAASTDNGISLSSTMTLSSLTPAFTVRGFQGRSPPQTQDKSADIKLWTTDNVNLLCPMSPRARGRIFAGGAS